VHNFIEPDFRPLMKNFDWENRKRRILDTDPAAKSGHAKIGKNSPK